MTIWEFTPLCIHGAEHCMLQLWVLPLQNEEYSRFKGSFCCCRYRLVWGLFTLSESEQEESFSDVVCRSMTQERSLYVGVSLSLNRPLRFHFRAKKCTPSWIIIFTSSNAHVHAHTSSSSVLVAIVHFFSRLCRSIVTLCNRISSSTFHSIIRTVPMETKVSRVHPLVDKSDG